MERIKARGYIKSGEFRGQRVPQHIQNKIVRYYCEENGLEYVLSRSEYSFKGSICHIQAAVEESYNAVVLYSLMQLPLALEDRKLFYRRAIELKKEIHFACENIVIKTGNYIDAIREVELILGCSEVLVYRTPAK